MSVLERLFGSVYRKLALALLLLLLIFGGALVFLNLATTELYVDEVEQGLNRELAAHLVAEQPLLEDGVAHEENLHQVFHTLMVINPRIECYLIDPEGRLLAYNAPPERVQIDRLDLAPVEAFLAGGRFPLRGQDPRHPEEPKIFSVAPVEGPSGELQGYLYVVLAGEQYASVAERFKGSFVLRQSLVTLGAACLLAALVGLLLFRFLTKRLRALDDRMSQMAAESSGSEVQRSPAVPGSLIADEIDRLGQTFDQMSERIHLQMDELERIDRLRRELVANVSHDLRTPVASLQGYLETLLLKEGALDESERREYLEVALAQSERLGRLVAELFELARLDSGDLPLERETFSISELAQDVAQKFKLRADERRVDLETELEVSAPLVEGDLRLLERTLENLIENALRHTDRGGKVRVRVERVRAESELGERVRVQVSDTGCGIAEEDVPYIFDRFYRGRSDRPSPGGASITMAKSEAARARAERPQGSGLGLAIAKRVIELHDSHIEVDSRVGSGTTFFFDLRPRSLSS